MKVNNYTKRNLNVRRNCPHWFVPNEMTQTSKKISGIFDLPFYTPVYTLSEFKCCVCGASPKNAYDKLAKG